MTRNIEVELEDYADVDLQEELRRRGYFVMDHVLDNAGLKVIIDMIEDQGYVVLEESLPEHVVWSKYRFHHEPIAGQTALDLWSAAQGIEVIP